jgi:hypothetical protein
MKYIHKRPRFIKNPKDEPSPSHRSNLKIQGNIYSLNADTDKVEFYNGLQG